MTKARSIIADSVLQGALNSYTNYVMNWDSPPALSSMVFTTDMVYDALNRVTHLTLPTDLDAERKKIIPTYNTAGTLEQVKLQSTAGTTTYVENIAYNAKGQRLLIAFGNNRMTRYVYDALTFRLLRQRTEGYTKNSVGSTITYSYTGGTNKQDDGFSYDLIGNIVNIFARVTNCGIGGNPDELDRSFEYDPIYRLTYADGRESNTQNSNDYLYEDAPQGSYDPTLVRYYERLYDYDKLGNVLQVKQQGTDGFTRDFTYDAEKNTLQSVDDGSTNLESYTYDACGNQRETSLSRKYAWNHSDQLICYKNQVGMGTPTVYAQYDYAGQDRVSKIVRNSSNYERTIYIDGIFEYISLGTFGVIDYEKNYIHVMDDKSRIAEVRVGDVFPTDISDSITYILEDQIGSSVVRLSDGGTVVDEEEYYPFGDSSLRTFTYKRYRYVGKERDAESGLYYYGARYYAAWTCRFISVDPLAEKYNQLTPYNYAGNEPIGDKDIDGMQSEKTPEGGDTKGGGDKSGAGNTNKTNETNNIAYKGGIQMYEAADAKGDVPGGVSDSSKSFKVGDYDVLPNYVKDSNGKLQLSHYTASIEVNQVKPSGGTEKERRIDYVFGKNDLQTFKDNAKLLGGAANLVFGANLHLEKWQIDRLNNNGGYGGYLKSQWTNPYNLMAFAHIMVNAWPTMNKVNLTGAAYEPVASMQVPVTGDPAMQAFLQKLEPGEWSKIFEAAYLDGKKVEVHYFLHKHTGKYFDSKIKQVGWSKNNFNKGGNKITGH